MKWVLIDKLVELTGYTKDAIRAKKKNGYWLKDVHWCKAPDGRILYSPKAINEWVEGR